MRIFAKIIESSRKLYFILEIILNCLLEYDGMLGYPIASLQPIKLQRQKLISVSNFIPIPSWPEYAVAGTY